MISNEVVSLSLNTDDGERIYKDVRWIDTLDPGNETVVFPALTEADMDIHGYSKPKGRALTEAHLDDEEFGKNHRA